MAAAGPVAMEGAPSSAQPVPANAAQPRRRTTITTPTGHWALGKTIGAGSMGKVKIAKNMETGEQVSWTVDTEIAVHRFLELTMDGKL